MAESVSLLSKQQARAVIESIERQRSKVTSLGSIEEKRLGPRPDEGTLSEIVHEAFWASLRREEGSIHRISLALLAPSSEAQDVVFQRRLPLSAGVLARLGPAVERRGNHLGVWREGDALRVWGVAGPLPPLCLVVEVVQAGQLVIKYGRSSKLGKFGNVAVLEGNRFKLVDESRASRPDRPFLLDSLVGMQPAVPWLDEANVLVQLALSMRAHGHGGLLLVVPEGDDGWRESVVWPPPYGLDPSFRQLTELMRQRPTEQDYAEWSSAFRSCIERVAGLTAIDGAVVLNVAYEVLAFGVMIRRAANSTTVERVRHAEPVVDNVPVVVDPGRVGHSRHLAAAQFVHDQHSAMALTASQDGRFTVFTWAPSDEMVHADRIDTLLL